MSPRTMCPGAQSCIYVHSDTHAHAHTYGCDYGRAYDESEEDTYDTPCPNVSRSPWRQKIGSRPQRCHSAERLAPAPTAPDKIVEETVKPGNGKPEKTDTAKLSTTEHSLTDEWCEYCKKFVATKYDEALSAN